MALDIAHEVGVAGLSETPTTDIEFRRGNTMEPQHLRQTMATLRICAHGSYWRDLKQLVEFEA
jgi:hypothetical protein